MIERLKKNKSAFIKRTKIHPIEVRMKKMKKKKITISRRSNLPFLIQNPSFCLQ